jgi:hypothetical protein
MRSTGQTPLNTNSRNRMQVFSLACTCLFNPYGAHDATDKENEIVPASGNRQPMNTSEVNY